MDSAQRSFYDSVWERPVAEIKSAVGKKEEEWWRHWSSVSELEELGYIYDAGGNPLRGMLMRNGEVKWVRCPELWHRYCSRTPQEPGFRCLNAPWSYDERMGFGEEGGGDQTWLRRYEEEEEDNERRWRVQQARQNHFARERNDKKVLKKKKRSAWINKKASKKRRKG